MRKKSHLSCKTEVNGSECFQTTEEKTTLEMSLVPTKTTEARVLFTWVTHDKTRTARCQKQIGDSLILGICLCVIVQKSSSGVRGGAANIRLSSQESWCYSIRWHRLLTWLQIWLTKLSNIWGVLVGLITRMPSDLPIAVVTRKGFAIHITVEKMMQLFEV